MTQEKIKCLTLDWSRTLQAIIEMERALADMRVRLNAREDALGKAIVPDDAKPGEPFHCLILERMLSATRQTDGHYEVKWRPLK